MSTELMRGDVTNDQPANWREHMLTGVTLDHMIDAERVLSQTQNAAQALLARSQHVTRQVIDTISSSTERLSSDLHDRSSASKDRTEPSTEQVTATVNELIEWVRRNGERITTDLDGLRNDLGARFSPVITRAELADLEARVAHAEKTAAKALKVSRSKKSKKV